MPQTREPAITVSQPASPLDVQMRWGEIEPLLRPATDRAGGSYEPVDLLIMALRGQVGFWFIEDGAQLIAVAVVEVRQYPRKRTLDIPFLGGERMAEWWADFVAAMDDFARKNGCQAITSMCAREGWLRFWKSHGVDARFSGVVVVRDL